jgi:hypothetical protein
MTDSVVELARSIENRFGEQTSFEATQTIEGPGLRVQASVRRRGLGFLTVNFTAYESPWLDLEEILHGRVEYVASELEDLQLHAEPRFTWVVDPGTRTLIRKPGRYLFEPIPGLSMLGEVAFLGTLTHDFLLRDLGDETLNGRAIRRLALKPKQPYRSHLLSIITYPVRRVTLDLDAETLFPARISFRPTAGSPAASIVGSDASLSVTYENVKILDTKDRPLPYEPPADARVLEESHVSVDELESTLPFPLSLGPIVDRGFRSEGRSATLTLDTNHKRGFALASFSNAEDDKSDIHLTLCVGNYVSRNMARLRATLSDTGHLASSESPIRLLDRRSLWEKALPGVDTERAPVEAFFEHDGTFWFLNVTGRDLDWMTGLASELLAAQQERKTAVDGDASASASA